MHEPKAVPYRIIRAALLAGVLIFGVVVWVVVSGDPQRTAEVVGNDVYGLVFAGLAAVVFGGFVILRKRIEHAAPDERGPLTIAGWALGEGPALFGGALFLLTGSPLYYLVGIGLLVAAFALFPVPGDA